MHFTVECNDTTTKEIRIVRKLITYWQVTPVYTMMHRKLLSLFLLFLLSYNYINAQQRPVETPVIKLKGITIQPIANVQAWIDSANATAPAGEEVQVILQFTQLPTPSQRAIIHKNGTRLGDYLPDNCFTSVLQFPVSKAVLAGVRSIIAMQPEWKVDGRVLAMRGVEKTVLVSFIAGTSKTEIDAVIKTHKGLIKDNRFEALRSYEVELPATAVLQIAAEPSVQYVGMPARDRALNYDQQGATGAEYLQASTANSGFGLEGKDITIGVGDNTAALFHTDLRDRVINFNPEAPEDHGVHTSGTTAGAGILDSKVMGMAPKAAILSHLYNLVWAQTGSMRQTYNMTLTNNSYAAIIGDCDFAGTYDQYAQMLDEQANNYPDVLHVFAAGNDGGGTCGIFPQGYATVVGGYQPAKNVVVVGNLRKDFGDHWSSGRGPVKDGRLKPEIMSFGREIYSTWRFDAYSLNTGTSMAAPSVTGGLALLSERYKQINGSNAPGNILKAILLNGATDLGNAGPDYRYGFGFMNLRRSLDMLNAGQYAASNVSQAGTQTHSITVPPNTAQLKVMLYWNDAAASPLAPAALVNNLDLKVAEPNNTQHLPLILNPTPANVADVAVEGVDNLNNAEQVTINNPQAGSYTITVSGSQIPTGNQNYVIAHDIVLNEVRLLNPVEGMAVAAGDSLNIYWEAPVGTDDFKLEYSVNNGAAWTIIDAAIPANQRMRRWDIPNTISSSQCLVRLSRNGTNQNFTSGLFTISAVPDLQLSATQCPGYIAMEWGAIANAGSYEIMRKISAEMRVVDTVASTNYTFTGLWPDSNYYVAVRPLIGGKPGYRSLALTRKPNDGNCAGSISDNDLLLQSVLIKSGRKLTSTELTNAQPLLVEVRNLDDAGASNFTIHYNVNGGAWQSQVVPVPAAAGNTVSFAVGPLDMEDTGLYVIKVAVQNTSANDPVKTNDTLIRYVKQLPNTPVDLNAGYADGFESPIDFTVSKDSIGLLPNGHWDFSNSNDSGRIRNVVATDITITGSHSINMDVLYGLYPIQNYLTGTFNLAGYDTASTEARVEFDYKLHGKPKIPEGNEVWVRGSDADPWLSIYTVDTNAVPGTVVNTGSLSITNALHMAGQQFTSSFAIRIGQNDSSCIAANDYGNGMTLDNFQLYNVKNDVQLLSVNSPNSTNCALSAAEPLTVTIYNSDNLPQTNVKMYYRLDGNNAIVDTLLNIAAKDTVQFTFTKAVDVSATGFHTLDVWLVANGDTYLPNDSILNYRFRNQPLITAFPYLQNFEQGDGSWYADGISASWQYGTPASSKIDKAASGTKAWKTNLAGTYNDNETSYLISPCFDISGMTNPMLSFSAAMDIENCGETLCDAAWVEWSTDGVAWTKLGASGEGTNWYGDRNVWNIQDDTRWKVASIALPTSNEPIRIRFVLRSDAGAGRDGVAIDDIHIFDRVNPLFSGTQVTATISAGANNWSSALVGNEVFSEVYNAASPVDVSVYHRNSFVHPFSKLYLLPRSFTIGGNDSMRSRFFVTDRDVVEMLQDNSCGDCAKAIDAYRLGMLQYRNGDASKINASLIDNPVEGYSFKNYSTVQWVPYDNGYYAEAIVSPQSEIWFATGLPDKNFSGVNVYPNPVTNETINIVWYAAPGSVMNMVLTDASGKTVYQNNITATDWDNKSSIVIPELASGVYILKYEIGGVRKEVKLVVY